MRYAKKSPEELQALRRSLVSRLWHLQPSVAEAARWIRESLGLNQREFAKLVGLSTPQIARLERGEANPTLETLRAVGKPYGLSIGFCHPDMLASPASSLGELPAWPVPDPQLPSPGRPRGVPPLTFEELPDDPS